MPDRIQLVCQPVFQLLRRYPITLIQSFIAQLLQVLPGSIAFRHVIFRKLRHSELNLHRTAVCDLLRILQCLPCIREQSRHLFFGLHIILPAFITHPVLIRQLFPRLNTEQDIMCLLIICIGIMHIIRSNQFNPGLLRQLHQLLVYQLLIRDSMILKLQKIIPFSENLLILQSPVFCLFIHPFGKISWNFSCKTRTQRNNPLMIGS